MRSNRVNYLVVGTFVIAVMAGLVVSVAWLTGRTGPTESYHAIYKNVTGIKFGSQVFYEGYPIGQVSGVVPEARQGRMEFRVTFDVREGWVIPDDSIARAGASGLLSAVSLNISAGTSRTALKPGARIASQEVGNLYKVIADVAADLQALAESDIKPLVRNLSRGGGILADILEGDGQRIMEKVRVLVDDLSVRAPEMTDQIASFTGELEELGKTLRLSAGEIRAVATPENRRKLEGVLHHVDKAAASLDHLMIESNVMIGSANELLEDNEAGIRKAIGDLQHTSASLARHIDAINHHMDGAARNMYEFSRQIRQNPGLLLGGTPPADNAARQGAAGKGGKP